MVPFLIVVSVLSSSSQGSQPELFAESLTQRYFGLVLANIVSLLICWAFLEAVDRLFFRLKQARPILLGWVLLFSGSLGFIKGYTTGLFSWLFGAELVLDIAISSRIVQTTLLGMWTIPIIALVTSTFAKYQGERQMLLAEKVEQALRGPADPLSDESSTDLREFIIKSKQELAKMREEPGGNESSSLVAKKLRELVETGLRPISHKIWDSESGTKDGFSLSELATLALGRKPFPLAIVAAGFSIGLLPINIVAYPLAEAFTRTILTVGFTIAIFALSKFILARTVAMVYTSFLLLNLLAAVCAPIATDLLVTGHVNFSDFPAWIALFLWLTQLSFFASVASEVLTGRAEIRKQLIELVGETGMDSQVRMAISKLNNRELAQYVHGNLQNRLLSSALKLEQEKISAEEVIAQLNEVEALLEGALDDYRATSDDSLERQLDQVTKRWAGFLRFEIISNVSARALSKETSKAIVQVVSEAVSNAARHGFAKSIQVIIDSSNNGAERFIDLAIKDDGLGPRSGKAGLGTELFAAISGGSWTITQRPEGGSELKVRIIL